MPDQFWSLTKREFDIKWAGFQREERRQEWLNAHHASLTTKYQKKVSFPEQLLGWGRDVSRYPIKKWLRPS